MKQLNFLSKSGSRSCGHNVVTLASTVGSPSAHRRSTMLKLISVLVLVLTFGVGNVWGMNANYTIGSQVTSLVDGDYVAWGTANNNLATSIASNWVYCGSTKADWIVFKVVKISNAFYLQNTADSKYVYSSDAKKVVFDTSNKTAITLSSVTDKGYLVNGGSSIGNYTFNSTGIRPYSSTNYNAANLYKVNAFAVTYNANGADGGTVPTDNGNYLSGATVTAKSNSGSLTRTGYNFVGWNTRADGNGTNIAATGSATFSITASTTLYAKWESAVSCTSEITITKGTPSHGSFSMTGAGTVCIDEGTASVTISDIEPASGYRFKEITSSGGGTINNNAKTVSNISATTTINVVFETIPSHKAYFYNGTTLLNAGGTSFQEGTAVSYSGSTPTTCDTGEGASTTFAGWATDVWEGKVAKNDIEPDFYESTLPVMGDEDVTYYAVFCKAGEAGSPTDKFSVNLQVANGNLAAPSGYTLTHASEWKNSSYRQDGSNDPAYVSIYHTSTKLFTTVPSTITVKAELAGGSARDPLNNSVYAVFLDNSGNEIDGSATVLCTSVTTSYVEKTANMPTSKAADAYGIKIRHAKESSYNVRYKSLTLSYATAGASTNYMTTCCNELGQINGSVSVTQTSAVVKLASAYAQAANADAYQLKVEGSSNYNTWTDVDKDYLTTSVGVTVNGLTCGTNYTAYLRAKGSGSYCEFGQESHVDFTTSKYAITKINPDHGTLVVQDNATQACDGTQLTLTATPTSPYTGGTIKVIKTGSNPEEDVTSSVYNAGTGKLTMPAYGVTISATFTEPQAPSISASGEALDGTTLAFGEQEISTNSSKTFTITGLNLTGDVSWVKDGTNASEFAVTSPASSPIAQATAASGQTITVTFTPTSAGSKNATLTFSTSGASDKVIALTGTGVNLYTVTFDKGTGVCETPSAKQTTNGGSVTLPSATPSVACAAEEWEFAGWSETNVSEETGTAPTILSGETYTPTTDKTLYAVYKRTETGTSTDVTILPGTFSEKGSNNYGSGAERTGSVSGISFGAHYITGNQANAPVNPCDGGIYLQCRGNDANIYNKTAFSGYITKVVVNQYAAQAFSLYCGNEQLMSSSNTSQAQTPSGEKLTDVDAATQMTWNVTGEYTFFDLKKGSSASYVTSIVVSYATSTTTYHTSPSCTGKATLTYDANGGENAPDAVEYDIDDDPVIAAAGSMAKEGHTFDRWNTKADGSGTYYAPDATITDIKKNMTLYAIWTVNKHTVAVASVDHTTITATPADASAITEGNSNTEVAYGTVVTLGKTDDTHFTFDEWDVYETNNSSNKVTVTETAGVYTFTVPDFNVTVSATAPIEDEEVTVIWHVNYNTSTSANIYVNTPFSQLSAPAVADNAVSTCANKFMGWATAPISIDNATSSNVSWADETNVSNSNKDFYAVWATGSASSTSFVKLGDNEASYLVQGAKIAIVNNKNDKILGSDFAETAATHPESDDNKLTVTTTQVWTLAEQDEYDYWKLTCGNVQLGTNNVASSGGSSEDIGNYTNDYSWWRLSSNTNWTNKVSGCYYMYNWHNASGTEYYNFLEYNGTKWVSYYAIDVTSGNKSYYAMKLYKPATDYSNYITNCCLPVENALTITNANQVATGSQLTLSTTGGNGGTVVWTVEAGTGTATISEGILTGGNLGTVTLKAHQNANGNYCATDAEDMTVTIVAATVNVTGVSLDHTTAALLPGETIQLTATVAPDDATDKTIKSWVSSSDAATVNAGLVTAVAKGTSTVTVTTTDGDFTDECAVTVHDLTILKQDETGTTIDVEGVEASADGKSLSASATAASKYVFKGWKYAKNGDGGLDAIVNASSTSITLTGTPTDDVTIIAEFYKPVAITWLVDGEDAAAGSQTLSVARGTLWSALTPAAEPDGDDLGTCATAFVGWSNSMNSELRGEGNPAPALLVHNSQFENYDTEITDPITFRAVFATPGGAGAAFDGSAGDYKIYALVGETKYYAQGTGSKIESTTDASLATTYTFEAVDGGFAIKTGDYYITYNSSTNLGTSDEAYTWTVGSGVKGTKRLTSETSDRAWIYRAGTTNKFGGYSTNNVTTTGEYYDLEIVGGTSYTNYVTVCCTPYTITKNVSEEDIAEGKTITTSVDAICDGMKVTLGYNASCPHFTFNEWIVKDANNVAVSVTDEGEGVYSFTMPESNVTVTADWTPVNYKVTIASAANGTATVKEGYATDENGKWIVPYGETVTLQATPTNAETHYFSGWTLSPDMDVQKSQAVLPITMTGSFTATPSFAQIVESALTLGSAEGVYSLSATLANGDPITNMNKIKSGTELKVTYELSGHNEYVGWTFSVNSVEKSAEGTTVTFAMPAEALNVSLNTRPYYMLNLSAEHGSITGVSIAGEAQDLAAQYIVHEGETIALTADPENANYKFKEWTGADVNANGQFTVGTFDLDVAAVFELKDTYTLTLMALGSEQEKIENILEGTSIWSQISSKEAPEIAGQTFLGWSMVEDAANMIISNDDDLDIDNNYPLYAVYQAMTPCYVKVTSTDDITNGKYLIVYETGGLAFNGGLETLDDSGNKIAVTISNNTIAISEATTAAEFTINTTDHTIRSASGKYIGRTSNANGLDANANTQYTNTMSIDEGNFVCVGSGGAYMRYNSASGQDRFRYFKSSTYSDQKAIQLYKRGGVPNPSGETASIPTLNVTTEVNADDIYPDHKAGNIVVKDGGKLTAGSALAINNFTIEGTHGHSGQVMNAENLHINGEAYFDFTLGVDVSTTEGAEKAADQWHNFSVPFPVSAIDGVFNAETGEKLTNEVDYAIEDYHGELRKNGEYGWKKFRGIMTPGHTYSMTVNGDIQTYRFKKVAGDYTFDADPTVEFSQHAATGSGTSSDAGWNGLGNMRLCYSSISNDNIAETTPQGQSAGRYVLVLDAESYNYVAYLLTNINLTVGSAFFIQASADGTMGFNDAQGGAGKIYAPARTQGKVAEPIMVTMSGERGTDHMYISADEDATSTYQIGRDMQRMFASSNPTTPLIYTMNYGGLKLAAEDAPMVNDQAVYTLQLYAPIAGEYTLQTEVVANADVYLTYQGTIIWNISESEYTVDLNKGKNDGYGLLLRAKAPSTATGVDEINAEAGAQKVIIDDHVYILRGGEMFDVTGKMVR